MCTNIPNYIHKKYIKFYEYVYNDIGVSITNEHNNDYVILLWSEMLWN